MKWLYRDPDAPSISAGVERELRRLGEGRFGLIWSKYAIDHDRLAPALTKKGCYVYSAGGPGFYLYCIPKGERQYMLLQALPVIDGRVTKWLEKNRWLNVNRPEDNMPSVHRAAEEAERKRKAESFADDQAHWIAENRSRFHDSVFEGKHHRRAANISSYGGQVNRSTPGEVEKDIREDGFTPRPEVPKGN